MESRGKRAKGQRVILDTLGVFMDEIPQGTGSLDEGGGTRGWSVSENTCVFTLRQNAVVYAGSSLYIRVTANNPEDALKRTDANNRWQVTMTSKGYHQYFVTFPPVIFNTIVQNFSSNTAVMGKIQDALIVPSNYMYSEGGVVMSQGYLNIFFRSEQGTGVEASVHVEAPEGFSFSPNPCQVTDLEDSYYSTPGQMGSPTRRLPGLVSCEHRTHPYNHAAIKMMGAILSNSYYAFGLWVSNAEDYLASQRTAWRIFTLDMNDYRVDGTAMPIASLAHTATSLPMSSDSTQTSFGLYRAELNTPTVLNVQVSVMSTMPYRLSMARTTVTILPLRVIERISSTLRVTSPFGYDWDFQDSEFRHLALFPNATQSLVLLGTNADLPGGYPLRQGNVLLWNQESLYWPNETYGFQTFIRVPDRTPTASPNAFIFEFGHALTACGSACRAFARLLEPTRLAWRQALRRTGALGVRQVDGLLLVQWPGLEVQLPEADRFSKSDLIALPLGARPSTEALPVQQWPNVDYRLILKQLIRWPTSPTTESPEKLLPLCPLCAGVAFYQGAGFTRSDIATGWQSFMLGNVGSSQHPLLSTLLANMGVPAHLAPQVLMQLRPSSDFQAELEQQLDEVPGLELRHEEAHVIDGFGTLWRGRSSMAQNIISLSLPCHRLCISGKTVTELGVETFFCEQVNKTANTSRTRVGRYLDDQPARMPRAHVFGLCHKPLLEDLAAILTSQPSPSEPCPFCGAHGFLLRSEAVSLLEAETGGEETDKSTPFHGSLWLCGDHLWGWRSRRAGVPATEVRALTNAVLEYKTNVETKVNTITFQIQTVTEVQQGGGIIIEGPLGFEFPNPCQPQAASMARGSTYQVEPMVSKVMRLDVTVLGNSVFEVMILILPEKNIFLSTSVARSRVLQFT
ncbi:Pentatricopeptide repeat-containing protein [Durusdinium trenchii]|uniref:Chloroplastic n=1 Tax=Durusdinium trenchii TaxID=1381693 RepID=A0ABP0K3Y9_9DINO